MKQGMHRETGELITGLPYLRQRFDDVMRTVCGQLVTERKYGANVIDEVDRNTNQAWLMRVYMLIAEAVTEPVNGLDDFKLSEMRVITLTNSSAELECVGTFLGEPNVKLGVTL